MPSYETTDVSGRLIEASAVTLLAVLAATLGLLWLFHLGLQSGRAPAAVPVPAGVPGPRLQSNPIRDLERHRREERERIESYGWTDASKRRAKIPVGRAMDLLLKKGLPARKTP